MADVYRIQAVITLGGNIAPELSKILKTMDRTEKEAKGVEKAVLRWASPIDRAAASMGKFSREVANARKGLGTVDREVAKMRSGMAGLKAPAAGLDREMQRWAQALGRPLAEMGKMRAATQGVGSAARGVSRSIDSWASRITKATSAMQRMSRVASNTHLPNLPNSGGGLGGRGAGTGGPGYAGHARRRGRGGRSGHGGGHGPLHHEGSALAGLFGVGGAVHGVVEVAEAGIDMRHIELGMRQTGATDEQVRHARETAYAGSQKFPNLSPVEIFEHINDLRGILGDMDKAIHEAPDILPEFSALKAKAGNHGSKSAVNEIYSAVKSAETANEITAEGVAKHVNALTRLSFWYGDKLNPSAYFSAQKAGGQMLNLTNDEFRYGAFAALSQEIGQRAGTQFATFAAKGVAGLKMTGRGLTTADEYGLLQPKTVEYSNAGLVKPGAQFVRNNDLSLNPLKWLYEEAIPKFASGNGGKAEKIDVNNPAELLRIMGRIWTDKNAYGFLFEGAAQRSKIAKDYAGFQKTSGDTASYRQYDPYAALQGVRAQGGAIAAAASEPAIPSIVENLNKLNAALGGFAKTLSDNPTGAQAGFAGLAGVGAGVGAAGLWGLGRMALPLVAGSPIGLTIGTATLVITGSLLFPWDKLKESLFGIQPGQGVGRDAHLDSMRRTAALKKPVGPLDFTQNRLGVYGMPDAPVVGGKVMPSLPEAAAPSLWERFGSYGRGGMKRAPAAPSMFDTVPGLPGAEAWKSGTEAGGAAAGTAGGAGAAIQQAGQAIGQAGTAASTAAPSLDSSAAGLNKAADAAKAVAGAADAAGGALAGLAAKISAMPSMALPGGGGGGGPAASPGAGGKGGAAPGAGAAAPAGAPKSAVYRGGSAPIHVATAVQLDGRTLGRSVTQHIVRQADTRNGTGLFTGIGAKTPPGQSMPIVA